MSTMPNVSPYIKAVVAALVAALTSLGTAVTDGTVSASEGVSIALAFLLGLGVVYAAPANVATPSAGDELEGEPGDDLVIDEADQAEDDSTFVPDPTNS